VYENVEVLSAAGMLQDDIADATGISVPTLRKYFRPELDKGAARQRARVLANLAAASDKGNVAASKAYLAEIDKRQAVNAMRDRERRAPEPKPERKGVKEVRKEAAASVAQGGGKYSPAPPPKLAVVRS